MIIISTEYAARSEHHSHAQKLLARCLASSGISYAEGITSVTLGAFGKPSLADFPKVKFSVSHADGITAAMVSDYECGIDCEPARAYDKRVLNRCFSEAERGLIERVPEHERELLFFVLWTLKESFVKATGEGLSRPLKGITFEQSEGVLSANVNGAFDVYVIESGGRQFAVSVCELREFRESGRRVGEVEFHRPKVNGEFILES